MGRICGDVQFGFAQKCVRVSASIKQCWRQYLPVLMGVVKIFWIWVWGIVSQIVSRDHIIFLIQIAVSG